MDALGILGNALASGGLAYVNSRLDDLNAEAEDTRRMGMERLKQQFAMERYDKQHEYNLDEADYRNRLAMERDERNWSRSYSPNVDKSGRRLTNAEVQNAGEGILSAEAWRMLQRTPNALEQKYNFYEKKFGKDVADSVFLPRTRQGRIDGFYSLPADKRAKIVADSYKAYDLLPLEDRPDHKTWFEQSYLPSIFGGEYPIKSNTEPKGNDLSTEEKVNIVFEEYKHKSPEKRMAVVRELQRRNEPIAARMLLEKFNSVTKKKSKEIRREKSRKITQKARDEFNTWRDNNPYAIPTNMATLAP